MENHFFPECGKTCQDSKFKLKVKESRRNASAQAQKHSDQFMYRLQSLSAPIDLHKLPVKQTFESWRDAVRRSTSQSTQTRHGAEQSLGIKCLPTGRATDTILTWEAGGTEQVPGLHRTEPLQLDIVQMRKEANAGCPAFLPVLAVLAGLKFVFSFRSKKQ